LKPPMTFSSSCTPSSSLTLRVNPSNLDNNTKVSYDDNSNVFIEIESDDIPSLRASINSYLGLAHASYRCIAEGNLES
jgi:tRNA threonylcarbamoyladenosine modification (KEOPS) complex  Pcc1 subunit